MKKQRLKALKRKDKQVLMSFQIDEKDLAKIKRLANRYTEGNTSAWIRYTSLNYKPRKAELE